MAEHPRILLFDIDGTLVSTGGAGAVAWRQAFEELYGIPADIGKFTDTGMTDPDVGHRTFAAVLGREPTRAELNKVMERRLHYLYQTVAESPDYRVLAGVEELLPQMLEQGYLLGLVTGNVEAAAPSSCTGPGSTGSSPSAATARTPPTAAS
jgi:phosphoglycolate phosphatase-like HAD superfamily hydrolase